MQSEVQYTPDLDMDECPMPEPFKEKMGLTVFLAWLFFLGFVARILFAPLMPAIEQELGLSHTQAGTLFLMMSLGYLTAPLCSGFISSKINHRGALKISAWAVGLALLPFAFVENIWVIRILLIVIGLAAGVHLPSAIAAITGEIRKEDWGKALSVHQAAPPLSFVSAPLIAALLINIVSWRMTLVIWAAIALISAFLYGMKGKGGDFPGRLPNGENVKTILSIPSFWIMVLLFGMAMGGNAGIYAMLPLYLVTEHGMELSYANILIGLSQAPGLIMVFAAGLITDKTGQKLIMAITLATAGISTVLIGLLSGGWLVAVIFIQPALLSSFFPGAFGALSRIAHPSLRSVTSALGPPTSFLIGGGLFPTLIGYLGETVSFASGVILAGCFMLIGPVLIIFLKLGHYDDESGC